MGGQGERPEKGSRYRKCRECAQTDGGQGSQIPLPREAVKINRHPSSPSKGTGFTTSVLLWGNGTKLHCFRMSKGRNSQFLSEVDVFIATNQKSCAGFVCLDYGIFFRLICVFPRTLCKIS